MARGMALAIPLLAIWLGGALVGCRTLSRRAPCDDNIIAARELTQKGLEALQRGRWLEAEIKLVRAIEAWPMDPQTHQYYAEALWHRGARERAIAEMEQAVRLSGADATRTAQLGEMHLANGDITASLAACDEALRADRTSGRSWKLRGDILVRQEDLQGALDAYHHSLSCDDAAPEIRMEIAELYRHRGDPRRALSTLQRLADFYDLDEKPWRIDELEGLAYQALDRHDEAVEHFEAAAARGEPSGALLLAMAKSQLALGHWEHARYSAEQARERQPELAAAADRVLGQMAVARSQPQAGVHR